MSLPARRELLASTAPRYAKANKKLKQTILDEFTASTGYHRKYAIDLLKHYDPKTAKTKRHRVPRQSQPRQYTQDVQQALVTVWKAANGICSKRLVPFLPEFVEVLEKYGHLCLSQQTRERLLAISTATVDRLLYKVRYGNKAHGLTTTKPGSLIKQQVPIRTFADWDDVRPGFVEADLVAHCGSYTGGSFLNTLTMTDIVTGWTECMALLSKDKDAVLLALGQARTQMPFPLLGLDTDNGSEFLNYALLDYCRGEEITFTRSRPYKKNDQCHVEQKNGSIVRKMIGYDRFEGLVPCRILGELYQTLRLYVNFFQPSLKLVSKHRQGSKVIKKYDQAKTPYQRVLTSETVSEQAKQALRVQYQGLDPVALLRGIERLQDQLWHYAHVERANGPPVPTSDSTVASPAEQAQTAEPVAPTRFAINGDGASLSPDNVRVEVPLSRSARMYRRTKKPNKKVKHWWRTRRDPFKDVWEEVEQQLVLTPHVQTTALFRALQKKYPGKFSDGQLRTLQRRVKAWRLKQVRLNPQQDNNAAPLRQPIASATPSRVVVAVAALRGPNGLDLACAQSDPTDGVLTPSGAP